jgi:hypothetical protein
LGTVWTAPPMRARPSGGGIDDAAAQCLAERSTDERAACEEALSEADTSGR